jgi:hypothetical protein
MLAGEALLDARLSLSQPVEGGIDLLESTSPRFSSCDSEWVAVSSRNMRWVASLEAGDTTRAPRDSRGRIAGGELRLGTCSMYMNTNKSRTCKKN